MTITPPLDADGRSDGKNGFVDNHLPPSEIPAALHAFLESLDTPAFCLDSLFRYTCFNSHHVAAMKSLYNADIRVGACLLDYLNREEDLKKVKENISRVLSGETVIDRAYFGDKTRSPEFFEARHSPIREPDGKITGVSVIAGNLTDLGTTGSTLWKRNAPLAGIISNSAAGIVYTDGSGNYIFTNDAFCELTGYSHEELRHLKTGELIHPEDAAAELVLFDEIRGNIRSGFRMELRIITKSGTERWGDLSVSAIYDTDKNPVNFIGVITDITGKKRAEYYLSSLNKLKEELLKSGPVDHKLKQITDAVVSIFQADLARIWTLKRSDICNSGCIHAQVSSDPDVCIHRERCLHLSASSGRYSRIDGDYRRIPMGCLNIGRIASSAEKMFITNDAIHDPLVEDHAWAESLGITAFAGFRLLSQELEPIGVLGLFRKSPILPDEVPFLEDLASTTSQILISGETDRALRESEEFLRSIVENIPNMIFVKDPHDLRYIQMNKAGEELLGICRDELIGRSDTDFFPGEAGFFRENERKTLSGHGVIDTPEEEILTRHSGRRILHTKRLPVFDEAGMPRFLLGISEDITEQKTIEAERDKLKNQLEYLLGATKTGIDIIDADFNLIYVDPAWSGVYGEYKGKKCYDYFNDQKSPCPGCGIPRALETREVTIIEETLSKEGRVVEVHTIPFQDQDGEWFVAEFNIDVTERKRAQEQIDRYSHDLEYLSRQSVMMLELEEDADIYTFIGTTISALSPPDAVVIISEVNIGGDTVTTRFVSGLTDEHKALLGDIGSSLFGRSYPLTDESISLLMSGGVTDIPLDLRMLSANTLPEEIYISIEKNRAIGKMYCAGIAWKQRLQGSVVILLPPGIDLERISGIEMFLQLAAIELKRRQIAADLREERGLYVGGPIITYKFSAQEGWPVIYVSPNIQQQLGYNPEKILDGTVSFSAIIHPDDLDRVVEEMSLRSNDGTLTFEQEYRIIRADGQVRHLYDYTVIERDPHGSISAYHGYILDISDRKYAEAAQKKALKLLNETQRVTKLGGWEYDAASGIFSWTEEMYHIHGVGHEYDQNDIERNISFYPPEDARIIGQAFNRAVQDGVPYDLELKFIRADGGEIWVRTIGNPVLEDGRVIRVTGIIMDISERKQLEISLREALQKLKVLTGITRHDVVNDLMGITLSLEIMQDAEDEDTRQEYLFRAREAGKVLEKTIGFTREYEDFGTISSGWYNLPGIITAAQSGVALGDVPVACMISPDLEIFTDPIIRKVFTTLFDNSVRHGGERLSGIRVYTENKEHNLVIVYEDDGIGVPLHEKGRIFEHGFGKNTGVGLFLAREILSITGFSVKECGVEGEGARFEILVPGGAFRYQL